MNYTEIAEKHGAELHTEFDFLPDCNCVGTLCGCNTGEHSLIGLAFKPDQLTAYSKEIERLALERAVDICDEKWAEHYGADKCSAAINKLIEELEE